MKYNPLDVENLLGAHPKISEVAIVPYPDPILGQRACCFVVPRGRILPTLPELCAYLSEYGVSKVKLPERLEFLEQMPVTPTRKVMKGRLKELLGR
jgi:non-ribosomal peptide synthetase component E (peptide arylation enzyme)